MIEDIKNARGDFGLKRATVIQFRWPTNNHEEGICLLVHRSVDGQKQCAILHRSDVRRNYDEIFPSLANLVHLELYPTSNLSAVGWLDAEFAVDLEGRIHYGLHIVSMADGTGTGPIRNELNDRDFMDWAQFIEPTVRFALTLHII